MFVTNGYQQYVSMPLAASLPGLAERFACKKPPRPESHPFILSLPDHVGALWCLHAPEVLQARHKCLPEIQKTSQTRASPGSKGGGRAFLQSP